MNQFVAALSAPQIEPTKAGAAVFPSASATPYEYFIAEKERLNRLLTNAGIDEDWAAEVAIHVAMEKTTAKLNPDDFEFCKQVYGDDR